MSVDLNSQLQKAYTTFAGDVITLVGTDSKQLLTTSAEYLADSKGVFIAIGLAALDQQNPMSWQEVKLKLIQEGKNAIAAFQGLEQQIASDIQSFVQTIINLFENLLQGILVSIQPAA